MSSILAFNQITGVYRQIGTGKTPQVIDLNKLSKEPPHFENLCFGFVHGCTRMAEHTTTGTWEVEQRRE
jgi:hypothetical protein